MPCCRAIVGIPLTTSADHLILTIAASEADGDRLAVAPAALATLAPLPDAILGGDVRSRYLARLKCAPNVGTAAAQPNRQDTAPSKLRYNIV
ncbi:MAG: hypothetical protein NVSMB42_23260 [Herpetosiphon sp.]